MVANAALGRPRLSTVAEEVAAKLMRAKDLSDGVRLTVPVLYPSGAMVAVRIVGGPDRYLVTDDGGAAQEADMIGAAGKLFSRHGSRAAEKSGVKFNSHEIFFPQAASEMLPSIVAIVAEASRFAVQLTSDSVAERLDRQTALSVADRIRDAFGREAVEERAEVVGASERAWRYAAIARVSGRVVAFEAVSPAPASVAAAYLKFDDVRRVAGAPQQVACLIRRQAFSNENIVMLNRTAKLYDLSESGASLRRLVA